MADNPQPRPTDGSDTPTYNQIFFDALDLLNKKNRLKMKHTKEIKCPQRGNIKILVKLEAYFDYREAKNIVSYRVDVYHTPKGKRKELHDTENNICTESEILQAKLELWEKIKPT